MSILVIAEHDNQSLKNSTLNTVSAALLCGQDIHLLVAGCQCKSVAEEASKVSGVSKVLMADATSLEHALPENVARQILTIAAAYTHILAPATSSGKAVMPRVAACLDVGQISEITRVVSEETFERPIYAGRQCHCDGAVGRYDQGINCQNHSFSTRGKK